MVRCPLCGDRNTKCIYKINDVPTFQNKVYDTIKEATSVDAGNISVCRCGSCGFMFNSEFDESKMIYDKNYQNEQAYSESFRKHLNSVIDIIVSNGYSNKKIIEIGCGKGYFLELLEGRGFDVTGFDPAYEGNNPRIVKDYFSDKYKGLKSDLVILRHTIEHVSNPLEFIKTIARACEYSGKILIETPEFNWVINNSVFWDICYEHCNYFTKDSMGRMFNSYSHGELFCGQYMYILADLSGVRDSAKTGDIPTEPDLSEMILTVDKFKLTVSSKKNLIVWGAGTKGVLLSCITDPMRKHISGLVDINPRKNGKYISKSGHYIVSPENISALKGNEVWVMNSNYKKETEKALNGTNFVIVSY